MRILGRTTISTSFPLKFGPTDDIGAPARTVWRVIADSAHSSNEQSDEAQEEVVELHSSPGGRVQVKARVVRDRGRVTEIRFEKSTGYVKKDAKLEPLLSLDEDAARRLIDLCMVLRGVDPSTDGTVKFDEDLLAALLQDPGTLEALYASDPSKFAAAIRSDVSAQDVVAVAARRNALEEFERLLEDEDAFNEAAAGGSREAVWQRFFEANPWVLGAGLGGRLFTSWDPAKLEKAVAGSSVSGVGKRVDALLATTGVVRSLVFAEVKIHDDPLLEKAEYRPGTWAPSRALVGGIAQALVTADRARDELNAWLASVDDDGFRTGDSVFTRAPASYLVIGQLRSLTRDGHVHPDQVRSFELFRRNTPYPQIVTYDEVLARARWLVELAEGSVTP